MKSFIHCILQRILSKLDRYCPGSDFTARIGSCTPMNFVAEENSNIVHTKVKESIIEEEITENQLHIFPNPFNQQTTIEYYLDSDQSILLGLYDINGKLVHEIEKSNQKITGKYRLSYMNSRLNSGIYYLVLQTDKTKNIQKVVLMESR